MFSLLHIDNNFFYKEILRELSLKNDFQYFSAKTPQRAYEILANHPIDIIVTGLEFQDESKDDFIGTLMGRKQYTTPVIVLTAAEDPALRERMLRMGVTDFLTKDHFTECLSSLIRRLQFGDALAAQLKTLRIAILDDTEAHLDLMKNILERHDVVNADCFGHPADLLSSQNEYDIYLIDCILPDLSGEQVISEIRGRNEYAVIIAVSSLHSHANISGILSTGADDYITKPISENLFIARIKANVRTYALMAQLKEKNLKLARMVRQDGLTGLHNHRSIMEVIAREIERSQRCNSPLSVLMFDIDHFKRVNDTYGNHIGDVVLAQIGNHLTGESRQIDTAGRYGGEEFICVLPDTDLCGAAVFAERLRQEIEEMTFSEHGLSITVSGGIAEYAGETAVELVKQADTFLYAAKRNGRNRIEY